MNEEMILLKALSIAGKYTRDNPPDVLNFDYMDCLIDGSRYINKWVDLAVQELKKECLI